MNGFFTGYGLVAVAIALVISAWPDPEGRDEKRAQVVFVAVWPVMVWGILETLPEDQP